VLSASVRSAEPKSNRNGWRQFLGRGTALGVRRHASSDDEEMAKMQVHYFSTGGVSMAVPLSNEIKALVDGPSFAHLATLMPDGSPQMVPVWVGREMIAY
jgi:hypothetical protein